MDYYIYNKKYLKLIVLYNLFIKKNYKKVCSISYIIVLFFYK